MGVKEKIDIDVFKVVTRAIAESDNIDVMTNHLIQLLVGVLEIKGGTIFALNPETNELEILASLGLSINYLNKGPVFVNKSIGEELIAIKDITKTDILQYPEDAQKEGIESIVSLPIKFYGETIGSLRLYHYEVWELSDRDLDSLQLLAENIGLAMMYTRHLNALQSIKETMKGLPLDFTLFSK